MKTMKTVWSHQSPCNLFFCYLFSQHLFIYLYIFFLFLQLYAPFTLPIVVFRFLSKQKYSFKLPVSHWYTSDISQIQIIYISYWKLFNNSQDIFLIIILIFYIVKVIKQSLTNCHDIAIETCIKIYVKTQEKKK